MRRSWLDLEVSQGLTLCGREKASASVVLPTLHARHSHALLRGRACELPLRRQWATGERPQSHAAGGALPPPGSVQVPPPAALHLLSPLLHATLGPGR